MFNVICIFYLQRWMMSYVLCFFWFCFLYIRTYIVCSNKCYLFINWLIICLLCISSILYALTNTKYNKNFFQFIWVKFFLNKLHKHHDEKYYKIFHFIIIKYILLHFFYIFFFHFYTFFIHLLHIYLYIFYTFRYN